MELNIGTTIKKLRTERGITQEELARNMNVSYQAVSKWENCTTTPDIAVLPRLAIYFGISLDTLFSLDKAEYLERIGNMIRDTHTIDHDRFVWAEHYLTDLLQEDQTHDEARVLLIELYEHRENRDQLAAIRLCKEGLSLDPSNKPLHLKLMRLGRGRGDTEMLFAFYHDLYHGHPQNDLVAEQLARLYVSVGQYDKATELIHAHPTTNCRLLAGEILHARGEVENAYQCWNTVAMENETDHAVLFAVAECFEKHRDDAKAIEWYLDSYRKSPSPKALDALYSLAFLYMRIKQYKDALQTWELIVDTLKKEHRILKGECIDWAHREIEKLKRMITDG